MYIALHAPNHVFVHAGVVGVEDRAIVLPGRSFAGKTTLVAALVKAGAEYWSDEYAVLDADGLVHPYPKPLSVRINDTRETDEQPVESLGGRAGEGPATRRCDRVHALPPRSHLGVAHPHRRRGRHQTPRALHRRTLTPRASTRSRATRRDQRHGSRGRTGRRRSSRQRAALAASRQLTERVISSHAPATYDIADTTRPGVAHAEMSPTSAAVGITAPCPPCFYARPFARWMRHNV